MMIDEKSRSGPLGGKPVAVIREVGPRDGFQSESRFIPTGFKARMIGNLADAGLSIIQAASFVHPKLMPQMADAEEVLSMLGKRPETRLVGLVLNFIGAERAKRAGMAEIEAGVSASETHSRKNTGLGRAAAFSECEKIADLCKSSGMRLWLNVQCAFGCGYEGRIPQDDVAELAGRLWSLGPEYLVIADTVGSGTPEATCSLLEKILRFAPSDRVFMHLHDTKGLAVKNLLAALEMGVTRFDAAFGGLGGCPFAPGAPGNLATERAVNILESKGFSTGVDLEKVEETTRLFHEAMSGRTL